MCMCVYIQTLNSGNLKLLQVSMCLYVFVCLCVYMCLYVCVSTYVCVCKKIYSTLISKPCVLYIHTRKHIDTETHKHIDAYPHRHIDTCVLLGFC